ncbi:SDR family oxidoreductase [Pedobacter sp. L105]|uniref:SDR family oxidoreductase n=1 Tax=Pedobacter sp. L105 TaxID=1641871 RepID=UPI00131C1244|nr:SDR family oxidoreductase [Pedobacter sp. L105]
MEENKKVWFVTGASKGMGLSLVKSLLSKGYKVAATSRNIADLTAKVTEFTEHFLPLKVDLTSDESVKEAVKQTVDKFGKLDVIVNNAGYALVGSFEELTDKEFRQALDVNLFGTVNVIRSAMPYLRKQRSGHIINISSAGGYVALANVGSYAASKFALVGITEALALEVKSFGVKATVLLPGSFRTNFLEEGSLSSGDHRIEEYGSDKTLEGMSVRAGTQPGDPDKLVTEVIRLGENENPPVHLILGPDSYKWITDKKAADIAEFEAYKEITLSTNFD